MATRMPLRSARVRYSVVALALGVGAWPLAMLISASPARALTPPTPATAPLTQQQIQQIYNPAPGVHAMPPVQNSNHGAGPNAPARGTPVGGFTCFGCAYALTNLTYHGGPVMQAGSDSVPIFWFPATLQNGASATPDPNYIPLINRYFHDVGSSGLNRVNSQYYQTVNGPIEYIVNSSHELLAVVDTSPYPAAGPQCAGNGVNCLGDQQLAAEVLAVSTAHALPQDLKTMYFLYTAPHESSCLATYFCFKADDVSYQNMAYCAYHSYFMNGTKPVVWANMPYGAYVTPGLGCTGLSTFPNNRDADITISITSHEQMEATTDPTINAWYDANGQENGDKCAYNYGALNFAGGHANERWNGNFYAVQQEWSNLSNGCAQTADSHAVSNDNLAAAPWDIANGPTCADIRFCGANGSLAASNVYATKEAGEPTPLGNVGGHSIWYSYTPVFSGPITFDTCGSDFDTLIGVYTGAAVDALTVGAENDDSAACGVQSSATLTVTAGTRYLIEVDGSNGTAGTVMLHWHRVPPPNGMFHVGEWSDFSVLYFLSSMSSVSCSTETFCAAVDTSGNVFISPDPVRGWTTPTLIDPGGQLSSVSCTGAQNFCVAVDDLGNALTYSAFAWSANHIDSSGALTAVSCPSATFCAAVDANGSALTFNGTTWSAPAVIDPGHTLTSVSCPTSGFCAAVDDNGAAVTFDGTGWSAPASIDSGNALSSVSCAGVGFCVAVDRAGNAVTFDGTGWSAPASIDSRALTSVSCPTATFCIVVDRAGYAVTFDGTAWSTPEHVDLDASQYLTSVSCPSPRRCATVDQSGRAYGYAGFSGGSVALASPSVVIGNKVLAVHGTAWNLDFDTTVGIYECATSTYSPSTCSAANATTTAVRTSPASRVGQFAAKITLAVGVIDTHGDTCGLASSPTCSIVVVGNSGDVSSQPIHFNTPTVTLSRTTNVNANYRETIRAANFPIGDVIRVQQCDANVTLLNLATNCDAATATTKAASKAGRVSTKLTVLVDSSYSDVGGGSCARGTTCYIVVDDLTNPAIAALPIQITLAP